MCWSEPFAERFERGTDRHAAGVGVLGDAPRVRRERCPIDGPQEHPLQVVLPGLHEPVDEPACLREALLAGLEQRCAGTRAGGACESADRAPWSSACGVPRAPGGTEDRPARERAPASGGRSGCELLEQRIRGGDEVGGAGRGPHESPCVRPRPHGRAHSPRRARSPWPWPGRRRRARSRRPPRRRGCRRRRTPAASTGERGTNRGPPARWARGRHRRTRARRSRRPSTRRPRRSRR